MEQIIEFFEGLFSTDEWPARWICGYWSSFHGWLYIASDAMIWFAYFAIPVIILNYFNKKRDLLNFRPGYFLFAAFILLCGSTHYMDIMMFWIPMYRLNTLVRFATGIVSIATVFYLIRILPIAFKVKTSVELQAEIDRRLEAEKKLEEANRNLQTFAYLASHDLQEPLRKIALFSSALSESNKDKLDEDSGKLLDKIGSSSQRLQGMITDVLNLSRIEESVDLAPLDPAIAITEAIDDLEIKIRDRRAVVRVEALPMVMGHGPYLKQLFTNLLSNALKFTTADPVVTITGELRGQYVAIHVTDNGIGMKQEDTAKIFEVFQRLVPKGKYEGSGIGLAICRKIVDVHKGRIMVQSAVGKGTTFTVELPAAPQR
jgi:two-component system, chemotaxis family, sensor kinase Cph1